MIVTNPKANYDLSHETEEEEEDTRAKGPKSFDYLPKFVRLAALHHAEEDAKSGGSARGPEPASPGKGSKASMKPNSARSPKSARV